MSGRGSSAGDFAYAIARQCSHSQPRHPCARAALLTKPATLIGSFFMLVAVVDAARPVRLGAVVLPCLSGGDVQVTLLDVMLGGHQLVGAARAKVVVEGHLATAADIAPRDDGAGAARQRARCEQRRLERGHDCSPSRLSCAGGTASTAAGYGPDGRAMRTRARSRAVRPSRKA